MARPGALGVVEDLERGYDDQARRLQRAEGTLAAIGKWVRATDDPAKALAEIGRLLELHTNQRWVPPDPRLEGVRARRVERPEQQHQPSPPGTQGSGEGAQYPPPPPTWGVGATVALALASLQLDVVKRSVLHQLFTTARPAASGDFRPNTRREEVRKKLAQFEERGWISRDRDLVRVLDRQALMSYVAGFNDPAAFAWVQEAVLEIRERYNRAIATPQAARAGRERRQLIRLATERPHGKEVLS